MTRFGTFFVAFTTLAAIGCESELPDASNRTGQPTGTPGTVCRVDDEIVPRDNASCAPSADDYTPTIAESTSDTWPACGADDGRYVPFQEVSGVGACVRVGAFEEIRTLLGFGGTKVPTPSDFEQARLIYTQEQGIESRVSRREDEHYPPAPMACRDLSASDQQSYPERCVGPVKIRPILNAAFLEGSQGVDSVRNAARVEAALLWFLYVSIHKEATSATQTKTDVDSCWAKYTGCEQREGSLGLASYVRARSPQAHDRIWDGILAVRCWRELDPAPAAQNLAMRDQARHQLDRALLRGLSLIVRQRAEKLGCETAWESVRILGAVLDREATVRDPGEAATLRAELAKPRAEELDLKKVQTALDILFPCP